MKHSLSLIAVLWLPLTAMHGQLQQGIPENGLIEWYDMDPAAVSNAVAVTAGTVFVNDRFGQPERALEYTATGTCSSCSGVDFVVDSNVVDVFSFAAWVKPTREVIPTGEAYQCATDVAMAWTDQNWLLYPGNGLEEALGVGLSIGTNGIFVAEHKSALLRSRLSYAVDIDDFVHVVVAYNTDSMSLFVNGELAASRPMWCSSLAKVLTAGANNGYPGINSEDGSIVRLGGGLYSPRFSGIIDDYAFWNRPLNAEEVQQLYALPQPILGCTDPNACNFDVSANLIDDSCEYQGCNDADACNFNGADVCDVDCIYPAVGEDCSGGEGLCGEGTYWNASSQSCLVAVPGDFDYDGCINVNDLLGQLAVYNLCFDLSDIEFDCGVDRVSYHGYDYQTVQIGGQCWFAENLRSLKYQNGDSIPTNLTGEEWASLSTGAVSVYGEGEGRTNFSSDGPDSDNEAYNLEVYGRLYNGYAKNDPRELCPSGWHVSHGSDWDELVSHFGGYEEAGNELKAPDSLFVNWSYQGASGFNALPGGYLDQAQGNFYDRGSRSSYWISSGPYRRNLNSGTSIATNNISYQDGLSIRCVRD